MSSWNCTWADLLLSPITNNLSIFSWESSLNTGPLATLPFFNILAWRTNDKRMRRWAWIARIILDPWFQMKKCSVIRDPSFPSSFLFSMYGSPVDHLSARSRSSSITDLEWRNDSDIDDGSQYHKYSDSWTVICDPIRAHLWANDICEHSWSCMSNRRNNYSNAAADARYWTARTATRRGCWSRGEGADHGSFPIFDQFVIRIGFPESLSFPMIREWFGLFLEEGKLIRIRSGSIS